MLTDQRKSHLLSLLADQGQIIARDVARSLGLSEDTIRRDLRALAASGKLTRVHGGALPASPTVLPLAERQTRTPEEKDRLARAALRLIQPGMVVFLDGGTTHLAVIRHLDPSLSLTIVTHSPPIAVALQHHPNITVILIGGQLYRHSMVATGAPTVQGFARIRADLALIGATGLHPGPGLTTNDAAEACVKRTLLENAASAACILTAEKIGTASPYRIGSLPEFSHLIVPDRTDLAAYQALPASVIRA